MKRVLLFVLLSSVALAAAAQDAAPSSVEVRGTQFPLPQRAYPMHAGDLAVYRGVYQLSNGERMTIVQEGRQMYATVGNRPAKKMVAIAGNEFVAQDRQLKVRFEDEPFNMRSELWMIVPRTLSSTGGSEMIRLVSLR